MTDPTGCTFLSYRRSDKAEVALLIEAMHLHGIPTWQDITDLDSGQTEEQIRHVLRDSATSSALLWLTPDVAKSDFIKKIEVPEIFNRSEAGDGFFVLPVAGSGLNYSEAAGVLKGAVIIHNLEHWKISTPETHPLDLKGAGKIAQEVLRQRLQSIHRSRPSGEPLSVAFSTWGKPPFFPGTALAIDWHNQFQSREARPNAWRDNLYPSLQAIGNALEQAVPGRELKFSGNISLTAATILGIVFRAPRHLQISWSQNMPDQTRQIWSLAAPRIPTGIAGKLTPANVSSQELAVLVSCSRNVLDDFARSREALPEFRAVLEIPARTTLDEKPKREIRTPGEAVDFARTIVEAIEHARNKYAPISKVHLFMAAPVGLAVLVGQLLSTLPEVQLYEHVPSDSETPYHPAFQVNPSF